ncbi:MAG: hypothetical protein ACYC28_07745 [Longimicrobiales bacterium]
MSYGLPAALVARRRPQEWVLLAVSLVCTLELLYAPHLADLKDWGGWPALPLPGMTSSMAELPVYVFTALGLLLAAQRTICFGHVDLGPPWMNALAAVLLLAVVFSLALGVLLGNGELGRHVRTELVAPLTFLVFMNLELDATIETRVWRVLVAGSGVLLFGLLLFYIMPALVGVVTVPQAVFVPWYALTLTLLASAVSVARLLFRGFTPGWGLVAVAALVTVTLHLTAKPVVFGLLVILLTLLGLATLSRQRPVVLRAAAMIVAVPLLIVVGLKLAPPSLQLELGQTLAARFLKQTNVRNLDDLKIALDIATSGAGTDVTEGRFDIWRAYLEQAGTGLGFAPAGFGHSPQMRHEGRSAAGFPPHNLAVYYAYHGGLIATFAILGLIAWFTYSGFRLVREGLLPRFGGLNDYEFIGAYAFLLGVTAISFVTTTPHANDPRVGWFFWFTAAMMVRRLRMARLEPESVVAPSGRVGRSAAGVREGQGA